MTATADTTPTFATLLTELELGERSWLEQAELMNTDAMLLLASPFDRYQVILLDPAAEVLMRRGFADRRAAEAEVAAAATARAGFVVAVLDLLAGRPMTMQVRATLV